MNRRYTTVWGRGTNLNIDVTIIPIMNIMIEAKWSGIYCIILSPSKIPNMLQVPNRIPIVNVLPCIADELNKERNHKF